MWYDDMVLELARIERQAFEAVCRKIAARQEGRAFVNLESENEISNSSIGLRPNDRRAA